MEAEEHFIVVEQMRVRYLRAGSGPPMLLIHGLVGSAQNWEANVAALSGIRTVYALDLINMGGSARVPGLDGSLAATADRVSAFMQALGLENADVAGHSHGGAVAMLLAIRHPRRVVRLVLFSAANPFCEQPRSLLAFYNSKPGTLLARAIPWMPRIVHDVAHRRMYGDPRCATEAALEGYTKALNSASIEHVLGIVRIWWTDMAELREGLAKLAGRPALLFWGDRDGAVSVSSGRRLAAELRGRLIVLPGVGHLPFAEKADVCNAAMVEFLSD